MPADPAGRSELAKPASRGRRLLVVLAVVAAVAAIGLGLLKFANAASAPKQIGYQGRMYMGVVEVTRIEATANFGRVHRRPGTVDGKQVFASAGRPPRLVALRLPDGHFNAYQLMR